MVRILSRFAGLLVGLVPAWAQAQLALCDHDAGADLDAWVSDASAELGEWVTDYENSRVQILVSEARTDVTGAPCLALTSFREGAEHVYVASAIKPLAAVAAIRVLEDVEGWSLDTEFRFEDYTIELDPPAANGAHTATVSEAGVESMGDAIRAALVRSSNPGYNRIYDLIGRDELNAAVRAMGFTSARLSHRLSIGDTDPRSDAYAPAVEMETDAGWRPVRARRQAEVEVYPGLVPANQVGNTHYDPVTNERVDAPFDFGTRNAISLRELHALLVALARPDLAPGIDLGIDDAHRAFVLEAMTRTSLELDDAPEPAHAPLCAGLDESSAGALYTYASKSGYAYGFHVENAWLRDEGSGREAFVTIALLVNADGVVNDNRYGYEEHSFPFMAFMGVRIGRWLFGAPAASTDDE